MACTISTQSAFPTASRPLTHFLGGPLILANLATFPSKSYVYLYDLEWEKTKTKKTETGQQGRQKSVIFITTKEKV